VKPLDMVSLDLSASEQLSDCFYTEVDASWQDNKLPVSVFVNNESFNATGELNIDFNAFASLGKDDLGMDVVNSINYLQNPALKEYGLKTGLKAFPLFEENKSLTFKVPKNTKVIIRNWFINAQNGVPFKVDSWIITRSISGSHKVKFYYNEPENYL
jgi:hypothetical protein